MLFWNLLIGLSCKDKHIKYTKWDRHNLYIYIYINVSIHLLFLHIYRETERRQKQRDRDSHHEEPFK